MPTGRPKKAVNVSIPADLLSAARAEAINLSATLETAIEQELRNRRRQKWLERNAAGISAYNLDVEAHGVFSDGLRSF
jgi:antitoxin CcdA